MSGFIADFLRSLWLSLTEPSRSLVAADDQRRARALSTTLLMTIIMVLLMVSQTTDMLPAPPHLYLVLVASVIAYLFSRTRYYRSAGIFAIAVITIIPTYLLISGYSNSPSYVISAGRLLLAALLAAYILFSLRASFVLALLIVVGFLLAPAPTASGETQTQTALVFMLTASAIFFIFVITRQYEASERKLAQDALTASEARYRAIVENQTEMICRWLPDETLTFVNEAYCRYFGKTRDEMINSKVLALIYEEDLPHVNQMIAMMNPQHTSVTYEHRVFNATGELRWHQWTDQAIYDNAGQLAEYQSVGRDITDLKRAEEAERKQREFAEALASTAALISSTLSLDEVLDRILDQVASINPAHSAEIILLEGDQAYVARSRANIHAADYGGLSDVRFSLQGTRNLREMVETGSPINIPNVREYEGWLPTHAAAWVRSAVGAPVRLEGETIGFLMMNSDTPGVFSDHHTARLRAFADQASIAIRNANMYHEVRRYAGELEGLVQQRTSELELAQERLRAILDGSGDGIYYTENRIIQYANAAFCKLTGYAQEELIGHDLFILRADENEQRLVPVQDALRTSGVWRGEMRLLRKDNTILDVGMTVALIGSSASKPIPAVTVVRDISREKALHLQRSNLVAYASHELRTPITNMKTRLYLLRRRPEGLIDHLAILDDVTERMRRLVEDLLDVSRLEHGLIPLRQQELSLQDVINAVVTLQQPEAELKSIELHCSLSEAPVNVSGDRERLIQVVTNLVTNAINYTPSGGQVMVSVSERDRMAVIEVEDTGIGIAPENLPYIFQPFYRVVSEIEGTGLGLSIAKEIIELHGGGLGVCSEYRRGSTFTITLPLCIPISQPVQGTAQS
ncbi:MAG: PAS domain S-box protein [Chloroflexota bacterium]